MRVGKINWVKHSNLPILSVDVQPNGFRFVTGGGDGFVCVWNLMPVISEKYENYFEDQKKNKKHEDSKEDVEMAEGYHSNQKVDRKGKQSYASGENSHMGKSEDSYGSDSESQGAGDEGLTLEEKLKREQRDKDFERDCELMAGLFQNDEQRAQRQLAVLDSHSAPVNCVRWNHLGTMFLSADDEGTIILWEYRGQTVLSAFQERQFAGNDSGTGGLEEAKADFAADPVEEDTQVKKQQIREDWKSLRTWRGHRRTVSDVTWSPDNLHFVSCGTDSTICIWNVNEQVPLKVLEAKANGLTFDPFGKFIASQSSMEKKLTIWRVQNYKNLNKECEVESYYKGQTNTQSLFRRLSWSSDGAFISTTGGKVGQNQLAPLIKRNEWNLLAALAGHQNTISVSRINPTLFKQASGKLEGYSVIALASAEGTITIWKPQLQKPLTILMDTFNLGVTDLSWGFNGNILLTSSTDGDVMFTHFQPGVLGTPCSEQEKRLIIESKYGRSVLEDYVKNKQNKQKECKINQLTQQQAAFGAKSTAEDTKNTIQEQKVTLNEKTGKKKIVPVMVQSFALADATVDPSMNPFMNQQLNVAAAISPLEPQAKNYQNISTGEDPFKKVDVQTPNRIEPKPIQVEPKQNLVPQSLAPTQLNSAQIDSAKSKKVIVPTKVSPAKQAITQAQTNQVKQFSVEINQKPQEKIEPQGHLAVPTEAYEKMVQQNSKEDIQINLPAQDIFSEEMRVVISNSGNNNVFNKQATIKVYNSQMSQELSSHVLNDQSVILATANSAFYALYSTQNQLLLFNTKTAQLIKNGLMLEGVCMMAGNSTTQRLCTISVKGDVRLFKVKELASIDSCVLEWQSSISDILRIKNTTQQVDGQDKRIYVEQLMVTQQTNSQGKEDAMVVIFLSDKSRYEYSSQTRGWSQIDSHIELPGSNCDFPVTNSDGQPLISTGSQEQKSKPNLSSIGSPLDELIECLEKQTIETRDVLLSNIGGQNDFDPQLTVVEKLKAGEAQSRIPVLEEALLMHARLRQKCEFMYTFRMLVYLLFHTRDFNKLSHLLMDYKKTEFDNEEGQYDETKFLLGNGFQMMTIRYKMGNVSSSYPLNIERGVLFRECVVPVLKLAITTKKDNSTKQLIMDFCKLLDFKT